MMTLDAIGDELDRLSERQGKTRKGSNSLPNGGFWEIGREHEDGAVTGTVFKPYLQDPGRVVRTGSFRIEPSGKVTRFPTLPRDFLGDCVVRAADRYLSRYQPFEGWNSYRAALMTSIEVGMPEAQAWEKVQTLGAEYQRQNGIAFLTLPAIDTKSMLVWLADL
jgi:hypothetical protein